MTEAPSSTKLRREAGPYSSSAISRSKITTCFRSSRAMPACNPGVRNRASSSRFLTRARWRSVCSG
jgi:hypothetical protein